MPLASPQESQPASFGISYFLHSLAGPARAAELLFLNEKLGAEECRRLGLVNHVIDAADFAAQSMEMAHRLAAGPTIAFRCMKQNLHTAAAGSLEQVIEREAYNMARCVRTKDVREASLAFREKRDPVFKGH